MVKDDDGIHFLVVRTTGITEKDGVPADAVVDATHWHPGDRDWIAVYYSSLEELTEELEAGSGWRLIQKQQLDGPYSYELIFVTRADDFAGPTGQEVMDELRDRFGVDFDDLAAE